MSSNLQQLSDSLNAVQKLISSLKNRNDLKKQIDNKN